MPSRSSSLRLGDILEAIEHLLGDMQGVPLDAFENDRRLRWQVERGVEIISEASRHLPADLKARHPEIPWPKVAGIGSVLRHGYEGIEPDVIWALVRDDLLPLEKACKTELEIIERQNET